MPAHVTGRGPLVLAALAGVMVLGGVVLYAVGALAAPVAIGGLTIPGLIGLAVVAYTRHSTTRVVPAGAGPDPRRAELPGAQPPAGPDAQRPASELDHLPSSSAAEFRAAAWPLVYLHAGPTVGSSSYLPFVGLRGVAAFCTGLVAVACFGEMFDRDQWPDSLVYGPLGTLVLGGLTVWLIRSKVRSNRRVKELRRRTEVLRSMSRHVDRRVADGEIPLAPADWQGPVPPALD